MRATLTFNLPEEQSEFQDAINGSKFKGAFWELDQGLFRNAQKYDALPHTWLEEVMAEHKPGSKYEYSQELKEDVIEDNEKNRKLVESIMLQVLIKVRAKIYEELSESNISIHD